VTNGTVSPALLAGVCFDANGTLFDIDRLLDDIDDRIGPAAGSAFIERLVSWSWLVTAADRYRPFAELAETALHATAAEFGVRLDNGSAASLLTGLHRLPLSPGAALALRELQPAQLAVLSNSSEESLKALMHNAGVAQCVPHLLSADSVGRFKPAPQVYALASMAFGVSSDRVLLVSAHEWDIAGAHMAGMRTAWVSMGRAESAVAGVRADIVVHSLETLPDALAQRGLIDFEPSGTTIPGRPMPPGSDYTGHDKISADSFPASDPPSY
jgi:2-haloacid dehalogenase